MPSLASLDPAIANAAFIELRSCLLWMFDSTEPDMVARTRYALASLEGLHPATALEARLAARVVAADIYASDTLRLAAEQSDDLKQTLRCRGVANALMRQADRAQTRLEASQRIRLQEESLAKAFRNMCSPPPDLPARPAAPTPPDASLPPVEPPPAAPHAAATAPEAPPQEAPPAPQAVAQPADPPRPAAAPATPLAKAEQYAKRHHALAIRIRRSGGLTPQATAGFRPAALPQDPQVLHALVHGASPILDTLDDPAGRRATAA